MKRVGNIYQKICEPGNIREAIIKSSLGKRNKRVVKGVLGDIDHYVSEVQQMLTGKSFIPSPHETKNIWDGAKKKERIICIPKYYPDQIVHWALILQIQGVMMKGMYPYNCGSVPGRGTGLGQKALRKWINRDYKGTKYCFKMDISKYYPSVDISILKQMFRKKIKDQDCLWLIDSILDSHPDGLPIGNYTSQWFANFFLQDMDHFVKEKLHVKYYVRYIDDLVMLGPNKRELHKARKQLFEYLATLHLKPKGDWQVFPINKRAIDFLGFRFFRNKTILRKRNSLRIRRRASKIAKKETLNYKDATAMISYWGWIKRSNSYRFYNEVIKPKVSIQQAKGVVSRYVSRANGTAN